MEAEVGDKEAEEFERQREMHLWDQTPASIGLLSSKESQISNAESEPIMNILKDNMSPSVSNIQSLQKEFKQYTFNANSTLDSLLKLLKIEETSQFKKDFKQWKKVVYTQETTDSNAQLEKKAEASAFISQIKGSEHKKKQEEDVKFKKEEKKLDVHIEKSAEDKQKLEQWLDDVLS